MNSAQQQLAEGILFTDEYQFTMAQMYFRMGLHEKPAQFDYFFRGYPDYGGHKAGYCINAGLEWLVDWMRSSRFRREEIDCLRGQTGRGGRPLFSADFLAWLERHGHFDALTMRAVPEGRVVHPNVPLVVVTGPLAIAQILETSLLNHLNIQTLIATKAARIHDICGGRLIIEFGTRRGHGKGVTAATRAALIGGAHFSSNVGISHVLGFPPKGTHAHSMVQAFLALGMSELDAFRAFAETYPDDCVLLVDTIDTLESGIPNAIRVFEELRRRGHTPVGIRLDSGDLAHLAIQAARMLDAAGFAETTIVLSNELDELSIWQILTQIGQEAARNGMEAGRIIDRLAYGVGTRLVTSAGAPSLNGVYKLVALRRDGRWSPAMKLSDSPSKIPNPGDKRVYRLYDRRGKATADLLAAKEESPGEMPEIVLRHMTEARLQRTLRRSDVLEIEPLLETVLDEGRAAVAFPPIEAIRARRAADLERLDPGVKRLMNPHIYHVSLSEKMWQTKQKLIASMRANLPRASGAAD
ncbi:MAG: nicotinate phosphoribosyltransferase [Desulfobacteraceae bacterium]|nr:MAG: nicotinate phosphoribosyltransferase [Desulfobacteraceae bacterium]